MNDFGSILGTEPSVESYTNESQISIVEIDWKLREFKIVRKYLTRNIKELSNVHICVLGCLLGQYCNSDDDIIQRGVDRDFEEHLGCISEWENMVSLNMKEVMSII